MIEEKNTEVTTIIAETELKKGYKKTKLGWIPDSWSVKRIDSIAKTSAGGTPSTRVKAYWNGNVLWMNSGDLNKKIINEVEGRITEIGLKESSAKLVPINSVLVGLAGQGKTRGTAAINKVELSTNQSVAFIVPNSDLVYYKYLYFNIDSRYEELRRLSTGDGGRGGLNLKLINGFKIYIPSKVEQK
uniref:restriction endonuclease subunit S n=1 Tax=Yeosuana marina TaxID=1565536 RepID=UPI0030C840F6